MRHHIADVETDVKICFLNLLFGESVIGSKFGPGGGLLPLASPQ
jgi:hypothetical protein